MQLCSHSSYLIPFCTCTGAEVAKQAADMILADDHFATLVHAVHAGRHIYTNIQAFVGFLVSCNLGEIFTVLLATLIGKEAFMLLIELWGGIVLRL